MELFKYINKSIRNLAKKGQLPFLLFSLAYFPQTVLAKKDWHWHGFEILGNLSQSRQQIIDEIPIKLGDKVIDDPTQWITWCAKLKEKFDLLYAHCGRVGYIDFKAYFEVSVVEKEEPWRIEFKKNPDWQIELANKEVLQTFDLLTARLWKLFQNGVAVKETSNNGYLEYDDTQLKKYIEKLIKIVPPFRKNLIEVAQFDSNPQKRAKAIRLLNWSLNTSSSIESVYKFLDDPSSLVRNNITRFMLHYLQNIHDKGVREKIIDALAIQLSRPSHGDRNKAIFALRKLATHFKTDRDYIKSRALKNIQYLAENSILSNVKSPANELLNLLDN